jgi:hypothetical protein
VALKFAKVEYNRLNPQQQQRYNCQKLSAILADFGFTTIREGDHLRKLEPDLVARHIDGRVLKIHLKGRLTFKASYEGQNIYVAFRSGGDWFIYPHDELMLRVFSESNIPRTRSWMVDGLFHFPQLSNRMRMLLEQYKVPCDSSDYAVGRDSSVKRGTIPAAREWFGWGL